MENATLILVGTLNGKKLLRRIAFAILATVLAFYAAANLQPLVFNDALSPSGIGQSGWPLAYAASFWDESVVNPHQAQRFDFLTLLLDISFFYLAFALGEYMYRRRNE